MTTLDKLLLHFTIIFVYKHYMFSYSLIVGKEVPMNIEEARKNARYSQEQAAERLGMSRPTYAKIEKNPDVASIEDAKAIAALFGVTVEEIFFDANYS